MNDWIVYWNLYGTNFKFKLWNAEYFHILSECKIGASNKTNFNLIKWNEMKSEKLVYGKFVYVSTFLGSISGKILGW